MRILSSTCGGSSSRACSTIARTTRPACRRGGAPCAPSTATARRWGQRDGWVEGRGLGGARAEERTTRRRLSGTCCDKA
eukprot:7153679-Prymnesium_polylepis.1